MPTLSIIRLGTKCSFTYSGETSEITRMLTQCALRDDLLSDAITQSALRLNQVKKEDSNSDQSAYMPCEKEIFYFSLNDDNSLDYPVNLNQ